MAIIRIALRMIHGHTKQQPAARWLDGPDNDPGWNPEIGLTTTSPSELGTW